jgi:hypothetical protein
VEGCDTKVCRNAAVSKASEETVIAIEYRWYIITRLTKSRRAHRL